VQNHRNGRYGGVRCPDVQPVRPGNHGNPEESPDPSSGKQLLSNICPGTSLQSGRRLYRPSPGPQPSRFPAGTSLPWTAPPWAGNLDRSRLMRSAALVSGLGIQYILRQPEAQSTVFRPSPVSGGIVAFLQIQQHLPPPVGRLSDADLDGQKFLLRVVFGTNELQGALLPDLGPQAAVDPNQPQTDPAVTAHVLVSSLCVLCLLFRRQTADDRRCQTFCLRANQDLQCFLHLHCGYALQVKPRQGRSTHLAFLTYGGTGDDRNTTGSPVRLHIFGTFTGVGCTLLRISRSDR